MELFSLLSFFFFLALLINEFPSLSGAHSVMSNGPRHSELIHFISYFGIEVFDVEWIIYSNILLTSMRWYYFVEEDRKIVMTFGRYNKYRWTSGESQGAIELRHSQFSWDTNEGTWIPWVIFRALMRQGADSNYMSSLIDIVKISFNR